MASERTRYISINLLPHHQRKLAELVQASGTNRNAFLRKIIMGLTPRDVEELMRR